MRRERPGAAPRPLLPAAGRGEGPGGHLPLLGGEDPHDRGRGGHLRLPARRTATSRAAASRCSLFLIGLVLAVQDPPLLGRSPTGSSPTRSPSPGPASSDFLHLDVHIPYAGTTLLWAVVLAAIFWRLAPQRGHALDPQHHDAAARGVLLGDRVRDLRARHRARRLHRDLAEPRLPVLGHPLLRRDPAARRWRTGGSA